MKQVSYFSIMRQTFRRDFKIKLIFRGNISQTKTCFLYSNFRQEGIRIQFPGYGERKGMWEE